MLGKREASSPGLLLSQFSLDGFMLGSSASFGAGNGCCVRIVDKVAGFWFNCGNALSSEKWVGPACHGKGTKGYAAGRDARLSISNASTKTHRCGRGL